ncbi:MAG TPA: DUF2207 domain-containing protein, partial [Mycobacterium sp.]|nr:DUF2207 domain-containing protein [Mycobacterium sp.]
MSRVRRAAAFVISLALIVIGLLWPLVLTGASQPGSTDDPVWFSSYKADYHVSADGRVDVTENITAQFPGGKHGIFEFWDVAAPHDPKVRLVPTVLSASMDGAPIRYTVSWEKNRRIVTAKIGDPDTYLSPGSHEYVIHSVIPDALAPATVGKNLEFASSSGETSSAPTVFYWFAVKSWNNRMNRADISVTLPAAVHGVQCTIGWGKGDACPAPTIDGNRIDMSFSGLPARTPVSLRAGVNIATPPRHEMPWPYTWDRILGTSQNKVISLLVASLVAGLVGLAWWRTTVETKPPFPLQYAPPEGLGPVQCEYIRTEAVPRNALTATLFYLAERGLVSLTQVGEKHWTVGGLAEPKDWDSVDSVSQEVGKRLRVTDRGSEFEAKNSVASGQTLSAAKTDLTKEVQRWAKREKLVASRGVELWVRAANVAAGVLAVCGFFTWGFTITLWGLPFAIFFVATIASWAPGVGSRRTAAGRELWSRIGGFHRMLTTDSAEARFDFGARKDLYSAYVPFAVATGAAALWAKKYQTTTGTAAPQPDWYHSTMPVGYGFIGSGGAGFDSFESTLSSSIGAYTASQSSSSGGGGGFGGGGGGGGGG